MPSQKNALFEAPGGSVGGVPLVQSIKNNVQSHTMTALTYKTTPLPFHILA
jgi:hypothetical protein